VILDKELSKVKEFNIVWSSSPDLSKYKQYFSFPEVIEFPTEFPGQTAYAYFYPASNADFQGLSDEKPPLLVRVHGIVFCCI
jgi:hypothetical protein